MKAVLIVAAVLAMGLTACQFSEFTQSEKITENIDDYRTGCEVDTDTLMALYKQWDANRWQFSPGPTPTPSPIDDHEVALSVQLEKIWEHGCETGRRDVAGAEQTTLKGLRDQLNVLDGRLSELEEAAKATPTPTPTP